MIRENGRTTLQTGIKAEIEIGWLQLRTLLEQSMLRPDEKSLPYHDMLLFSITEEELNIFGVDQSMDLKTHLSADRSSFQIGKIADQTPIKALVDSKFLIKRMEIALIREQDIPTGRSKEVKLQFVNQDEFGFVGHLAIDSRHTVTVGCQSTEEGYHLLPQEMGGEFLRFGTIELENIYHKPSISISTDSLVKMKEIVSHPRLLSVGENTFAEGPDINISLSTKKYPHMIVEKQNGPSVLINSSEQLDRIAKSLSDGAVKLYSGNQGQSICQTKEDYIVHHQILPEKYKVISEMV